MDEIVNYAANHWLEIVVVIGLMIIAFCWGGRGPTRRHTRDLEVHLDWLRSYGEGWRDIALGEMIEREGLSEDLIADLIRVEGRVKAERKISE